MSLILGWICLAIVLAVLLMLLVMPKPKSSRKSKQRFRNNRYTQQSPQQTGEIEFPDSSKYKKLLSLLNGDTDTADRLSRAYGVEKAIEDLIRDRQ